MIERSILDLAPFWVIYNHLNFHLLASLRTVQEVRRTITKPFLVRLHISVFSTLTIGLCVHGPSSFHLSTPLHRYLLPSARIRSQTFPITLGVAKSNIGIITMATSKERRANNVELKSGQFDFTVEFASKKEDNSPIFDKFLQTPKIDPITDNANYRVSACLDSVSGNIIIRETYVLVQNGTCNLELTLSSSMARTNGTRDLQMMGPLFSASHLTSPGF